MRNKSVIFHRGDDRIIVELIFVVGFIGFRNKQTEFAGALNSESCPTQNPFNNHKTVSQHIAHNSTAKQLPTNYQNARTDKAIASAINMQSAYI